MHARLAGVADAFLMGERPIARRLDDSIARAGVVRPGGPASLARLCAGQSQLPDQAAGAGPGCGPEEHHHLVVDGQAFVSQHIGDLSHYQAFQAFRGNHSGSDLDV